MFNFTIHFVYYHYAISHNTDTPIFTATSCRHAKRSPTARYSMSHERLQTVTYPAAVAAASMGVGILRNANHLHGDCWEHLHVTGNIYIRLAVATRRPQPLPPLWQQLCDASSFSRSSSQQLPGGAAAAPADIGGRWGQQPWWCSQDHPCMQQPLPPMDTCRQSTITVVTLTILCWQHSTVHPPPTPSILSSKTTPSDLDSYIFLSNFMFFNSWLPSFRFIYMDSNLIQTDQVYILKNLSFLCIYFISIVRNVDQGGHVSILVLLDLSSAFDTVDHDMTRPRCTSSRYWQSVLVSPESPSTGLVHTWTYEHRHSMSEHSNQQHLLFTVVHHKFQFSGTKVHMLHGELTSHDCTTCDRPPSVRRQHSTIGQATDYICHGINREHWKMYQSGARMALVQVAPAKPVKILNHLVRNPCYTKTSIKHWSMSTCWSRFYGTLWCRSRSRCIPW